MFRNSDLNFVQLGLEMANYISEYILKYLKDKCPANSLEIAAYLGEDHQRIVGGIKSLQAVGDVIEAQQITSKKLELTEEGQCVAETGSHEAHIFNAVPENGIAFTDLMEKVPNGKVGFNKAMSFGWIKADKQEIGTWVTRKTDAIMDTPQQHLQHILNNSAHLVNVEAIQDYRKRKLVREVTVKSYEVTRGPGFTTSIEKAEADLTVEMILSGTWKTKKFKPYNLDALGSPLSCGHLHPLLRVRSEFRQIFLEMGFTEMPTNNFVENSFWNFDALFQPQQHPARDAHDTFFLSDPMSSSNLPPGYLEKVKQVHSIGGYGSQGYNYEWRLEEAEKNLLRTHTTATSARMLYQLAKEEKFHPVKFFSIDRVFRNETLDATHLAEFHQVEGLIADYNLTLGNLIGVLYQFFSKLGITQLQFKPAYNPYTEPSMEIFCYHKGLEKWIEVGNSGVFRPEMLFPMGLPEDVTVIAWGLSLERPTMIKYGIKNIRDLVGPRVNLQMVYESPLCRLEKTSKKIHEETSEENLANELDKRWKIIMDKLQTIYCDLKKLKNTVATVGNTTENVLEERYSFVIMANPLYPPYSASLILQIIAKSLPVTLTVSAHSSVKCPPQNLKSLFPEQNSTDDDCALKVHLIWKEMEHNPHLVLSPVKSTCIIGEVNIARFLLRIIENKLSVHKIVYESKDMHFQVLVDVWLDNMHKVLQEKDKIPNAFLKKVNNCLANKHWLVDNNIISLADILLWSLIKGLNFGREFPHISTWLQKASQHEIFCSNYCKGQT